MRTLNYTGRRKLPQTAVSLAVFGTEHGREFSGAIALDAIKFRGVADPEWSLIIEASNGVKFARFDHGTVATPKFNVRHSLAKFSQNETISFRAKIVAVDGHLVALADHIVPREPQVAAAKSLLPVSVEPLDGLIYRVDFDEDGSAPRLVLNELLDNTIPQGIKAVARSPMFVALVYPNVVREILTRILIINEWVEPDAPESSTGPPWASKWLRLATKIAKEPVPGDADEGAKLLWIDVAVSAFGRHFDVIRKFDQQVSLKS